jgi:hypothetical protein
MHFRILGFVCLFFLSIPSKGQLTVSGSVIDKQSGRPLENASVFVNNTTVGTISSSQGKFTLYNLQPGQYDLVVSMVGYETALQSLNVQKSLNSIFIQLKPKTVTLKPVIILPDKLRLYYLNLFKKGFIGKYGNASSCTLVNPEALSFDFDSKNNTLRVSADEFIIVENKNLGYRIEFLLNQFVYTMYNNLSHSTYYDGQALFKELDGGKAKKKQWHKNRLKAYSGSVMHFLNAAATDKLTENGFILHTLVRKKNDQRPPDQMIEAKIGRFRKPAAAMTRNDYDSLEYWTKKAQMPTEIQYLLRDTIRRERIIFRTDINGVFALKFENYLYIVHTNGKSEFRSAYYNHNSTAIPYSVISLKEDYALFDQSGIVLNPSSLIFEGYFGEMGGLASMLPTDYEPVKK